MAYRNEQDAMELAAWEREHELSGAYDAGCQQEWYDVMVQSCGGDTAESLKHEAMCETAEWLQEEKDVPPGEAYAIAKAMEERRFMLLDEKPQEKPQPKTESEWDDIPF